MGVVTIESNQEGILTHYRPRLGLGPQYEVPENLLSTSCPSWCDAWTDVGSTTVANRKLIARNAASDLSMMTSHDGLGRTDNFSKASGIMPKSKRSVFSNEVSRRRGKLPLHSQQ